MGGVGQEGEAPGGKSADHLDGRKRQREAEDGPGLRRFRALTRLGGSQTSG